MSHWFHPEEDEQLGQLMESDDDHPRTHYLLMFADGESCIFI